MKSIILPIILIPPIPFLIACANAETVIIDGGESYEKQTIRNRYHVLSANGILPLTINVAGQKGKKIPIGRVKIDYDKQWVREHLRGIESSYRSAPFFDHYYPIIKVLLEKKYLNMEEMFLSCFPHWLRISGLNCTWKYDPTFVETRAVMDFRRPIKKPVDFPKSISTPPYMQVFRDRFSFVPNLSIIDLLMNEGPAANTILSKSME